MSYSTVLLYVIQHCVIICHTALCYYMSYSTVLLYVMQHCVSICHTALCYYMSYSTVLLYVIQYCVIICHTALCYYEWRMPLEKSKRFTCRGYLILRPSSWHRVWYRWKYVHVEAIWQLSTPVRHRESVISESMYILRLTVVDIC